MRAKKNFILVAMVVIIVALFYLKNQPKRSTPQNNSADFFVSKNAIYVAEQTPGKNVVVSVVRLAGPGFVVIHEDASGAPGKVLGASNLLPSGETKNLSVTLSRETKNDETVYAMLHFDGGDGKFNAADDRPAIDPVGNEPVMTMVIFSTDAVLPNVIAP